MGLSVRYLCKVVRFFGLVVLLARNSSRAVLSCSALSLSILESEICVCVKLKGNMRNRNEQKREYMRKRRKRVLVS